MQKLLKSLHKVITLLCTLSLLGCYPPLEREVQGPGQALSRVRFFYPQFNDDMDTASLILALERNQEYLNRLDPEEIFYYGPDRVTCAQFRKTQEAFLSLLKNCPSPEQWQRKIRKHFRVYRAAGRPGTGKTLFTGYFEPVFEGSLIPDETFKYPVYRKPEDLVRIDLSLFKKSLEGESIVARIDGKEVIPYYSRYQIEKEKPLQGRNLEIAWLRDPVDVAFLHIQGSGRIKLTNGQTILVGYEASNGLPYRSIGRYMLDNGYLTEGQMSMQGIRRFLQENPEVVDEILNYNPSYVFFKILERGPLGNIGVPLTPGRSLALDARLFPKGALAFITCEKPVVDSQCQITGWQKFSRFVLNQDTGGAIKGAGRADLFWGSGPYAQVVAGHLQHEGELYILLKKP
jgi:membrane-bound lytic murein transglycosylase A